MKKILFGIFIGLFAISASFAAADCPKDMLPENATYGHKEVGEDGEICIVDGCIGGYNPSSDRMSCVLNAEEQKKIAEAQAKYDLAHENEQSLANRMLGATTMLTMGLGGEALAQSMAEQAADVDAERDMAAYLASFRCDYGAGRNIKGGDKNVELPGGNLLIPMYSEYVALANDLRARKEQLGLKAGIESEPILDSATTGLYDDVSTGITSGEYASLARAMLDPTGADAKMWAEQKEKTQQNLVAGAAAVGVGAVVGIAGNIAHTKAYKNKLKSVDIKDDLDNLAKTINSQPSQEAKKCPSGASGTVPNCDCGNNHEYNPNIGQCERCLGNQTVKDGRCGCHDSSKPNWNNDTQTCVAAPAAQISGLCAPECDTPTISNHLVIDYNCNCSCTSGYTYFGKKCIRGSLEKYDIKLPSPSDVIRQGMIKNQGETKIVTIGGEAINAPLPQFNLGTSVDPEVIADIPKVTLSAHNLFKTGSSDLTSDAQTALKEFVDRLKNKQNISSCEFKVVGYTDKSGSPKTNMDLSKQRAKAVGEQLQKLLNEVQIESEIATDGVGEDMCFCEEGRLTGPCAGKKKGDEPADGSHYRPCRKVEISATCFVAESGETEI